MDTQVCISNCSFHNSALSQTVKNLICGIGTRSLSSESELQPEASEYNTDINISDCGVSFFTTEIVFSIDECVKHFLKTKKELPWMPEDYKKAVYDLSPIFKECEQFLQTKQTEEFCDLYRGHFEWTKNLMLFLDIFELLASGQGDKDLLALLLICGGIEHALGNVYLLRGTQCPTLLKDLLCTDELRNVLGDSEIKIFHVLMGPPISMNLRNVAWHGFFSVGELPKRYVYFLLAVTASLNQSLLSKGILPSSITDRPYYSLLKADEIHAKFPDLNGQSIGKLEKCVINSWLIENNNSAFIQGIFSLYRDGKYGFSCALALPVFEHVLRRVFVSANNCPERLLTAEATTLFTTFEEILNYCLPDGKKNNLISTLGEPFLDLLHDLLIYPNGPRARDKLGHGEADYYNVPQSLASVIILSMAFVAVKPHGTKIDDPVVVSLLKNVEDYESIFHPLAMLKCKIIELAQSITTFHGRIKTSPDLNDWDVKSGFDVFVEENLLFKDISHHVVTFLESVHKLMPEPLTIDDLKCRLVRPFSSLEDFVVPALNVERISTLHRWQKSTKLLASDVSESEIVSLLLKTSSEAATSLSQCQETLILRQQQLFNKNLRSRQRQNMKRLLYFLPTVNLMLNYIIVLSLSVFHHLNTHSQTYCKNLKLIQRFLKSNLQVTENLRTFTANDKNKWIQAEELIAKAVQSGTAFMDQWQSDS